MLQAAGASTASATTHRVTRRAWLSVWAAGEPNELNCFGISKPVKRKTRVPRWRSKQGASSQCATMEVFLATKASCWELLQDQQAHRQAATTCNTGSNSNSNVAGCAVDSILDSCNNKSLSRAAQGLYASLVAVRVADLSFKRSCSQSGLPHGLREAPFNLWTLNVFPRPAIAPAYAHRHTGRQQDTSQAWPVPSKPAAATWQLC